MNPDHTKVYDEQTSKKKIPSEGTTNAMAWREVKGLAVARVQKVDATGCKWRASNHRRKASKDAVRPWKISFQCDRKTKENLRNTVDILGAKHDIQTLAGFQLTNELLILLSTMTQNPVKSTVHYVDTYQVKATKENIIQSTCKHFSKY